MSKRLDARLDEAFANIKEEDLPDGLRPGSIVGPRTGGTIHPFLRDFACGNDPSLGFFAPTAPRRRRRRVRPV